MYSINIPEIDSEGSVVFTNTTVELTAYYFKRPSSKPMILRYRNAERDWYFVSIELSTAKAPEEFRRIKEFIVTAYRHLLYDTLIGVGLNEITPSSSD
jgi:hypothetical protein